LLPGRLPAETPGETLQFYLHLDRARIPSDGMKQVFLILLLVASVWGQAPSNAPASSSDSASTATAAPAAVSLDQENARKAKEVLEQAIQALGGDAYLNLRNRHIEGRSFSFYHGRATSNGVLFWGFTEYPDKERVEVTKERDVAYIYSGDKGFEITYKGAHPMENKDLVDYLRRRKFGLDRILRTWVNDPTVALFFDGQAIAEQQPALKVTLINAKNEAVTLFFDQDSHVPIKKTFKWRDPIDHQNNVEDEVYYNYRVVQGINTAYGFTRYYNGDMASQRSLNAAFYNENLNESMFDPNSNYNPNKPSGKH
jgi:hypothetical protein